MATGNTEFGTDGLLSTTIDHFVSKLEAQAWERTVLLSLLRQNGMPSQNGDRIVQPLLYGQTSAKGSFADDDVFSAPTRDGITAAAFEFKQYYASIMITGVEKAKNSGREQILSLLKARLKQAEMSIADDVNEMLYGDGSGNSNKDFDGLAALIAAGNTYGGIDRSDANNAWWRGTRTDLSGALTLAAMRTAYNDGVKGTDSPTHIITTQEGFESYEELAEGSIVHEDTALADMGFDNLKFKSAPVVFDRDVADGEMHFLNMDYIEFVTLDGKWFDVSEWLRPTNQDAQYKNILLYGNLTCKNADLQQTVHGITDA